MKFSSFINLFEGQEFGITHIEDLGTEIFVRMISNIKNLTAVQKLDGANLVAGIDTQGKLYTSREQKGGDRYYKVSDYPSTSTYDGFRAAAAVLDKLTPKIHQVLSPGEAVNIEVLFGEQPNTVFYGLNNLNYIAFLEMIPGDDPSIDPNQDNIDKLVEICGDEQITVKTDKFDTTDGQTLVKVPTVSQWKITKSDSVSSEDLNSLNFTPELTKLKSYLKSENSLAKKQGKHLTNFEVTTDRSKDLTDERTKIEKEITDKFKLPIKNQLLKLVQQQKPSLRGEMGDEGAYHGVEGIIFTDPETRERFKVVDRETFTKINKFNYQVRNNITGKIISADTNLPIESRGGIVGSARLRAIRMFGLDTAELPNQAKRVLEKFKGSSRDETVKNIADSLHQLKFESLNRKLQAIYINALDDLDDDLTTFRKNADEYSLDLSSDKKIKYTPEIKRRTLLTFAEARKNLLGMIKQIRDSKYMEDLIETFFSSQLDKISED